MSNLVPFNFKSHAIRTVVRDDEPWFVAADVCAALGYANSRDAIASHLDDDEKGVAISDTLGGDQSLTIISESGLYALVLRSRKPEARKFAKWVTKEVLPSIRKRGSYQTGAQPPAIQRFRPVEPGREYFPIHWALAPPPQGPSVTLDSRNLVRVWRLINYFKRVDQVCREFKIAESLENMGSPAGRRLALYLLDGRMLGVDGLERELGPIMEAARAYGRDVLGFNDLGDIE